MCYHVIILVIKIVLLTDQQRDSTRRFWPEKKLTWENVRFSPKIRNEVEELSPIRNTAQNFCRKSCEITRIVKTLRVYFLQGWYGEGVMWYSIQMDPTSWAYWAYQVLSVENMKTQFFSWSDEYKSSSRFYHFCALSISSGELGCTC